jgi:hypothetical protein
LDAEGATLAALLLDASRVVPQLSGEVAPCDFYSTSNRFIAESALALHAAGKAVDAVTVATHLRELDLLSQIGGTPYLAQLTDATPAVAHVVDHARIVRQKARLRRLISGAQAIVAHAKTGGDVAGVVCRLRELAADVERGGGPSEQPTSDAPLRGLEALGAVAVVGREAVRALATLAVMYIWQDIAVAGTIVLIAGPPAEGKTTLLFLIFAARMNTGAPVTLLGRPIRPAPPGQYLVLIEGEHSDASTARKLAKSIRLLGIDDAGLDRVIIIARKAVRLHSPEWLDIGKMVAAGLVSDIAVDTIARVAPADANDEREQVAVFDEVARTIELAPEGQPKPAVWCNAHTRKNGTSGDLADVSGSAQRTGQADSVLMIKGEKVGGRTVATTVTFAKLREDPDDFPMPVTFSIVMGDGEPRLIVKRLQEADNQPLEARIIEHLRVHGPTTKNALSKGLKRNTATIDGAISALFDAKGIVSTTVTIRGRTEKAFGLREIRPDFDPAR